MVTRQKILVTGSNGQLGSELRDLASSYPHFEFLFTTRDELPIDEYQRIEDYFVQHQPAYCINCAAYTAVDKAELKEEELNVFKINADAVRTLAGICKKNNTKLIHISSDYVFDGTTNRPYTENDPPNPVNVYGMSKLIGEIGALSRDSGIIIIRASWVYSSYGKNFVKTMLRLMNEKKEINVVSDQIGCPTYAADLAEAILQAIRHLQTTDSSISGIFHYTNAGVISWYDFAREIRYLSKSDCMVNPIPTSAYPTPARRPSYSVLDTTKFQKTFSIPVKDWKESLKRCLKKIEKS